MLNAVVDHLTGNMNVLDAIGSVTRKLSRGSSRFKNKNSEVEPNALPLLADVSAQEQEDLFIKKLEQCCVMYDFQDPCENVKGKESKRKTFEELVSFISSNHGVLTEKVYPEIFNTFSKNVFRVLPPSEYQDFDPESDDPTLELSWPHISQAYELLLWFLESPNFVPSVAKKYINQNFVHQLLELLDSEDPRERMSLKMILHRIYGKILGLRSYIRKKISYIFLRFVYENDTFHGISELLEVLGTIINGFALPLKEEHKNFLTKILFPLHKPSSLASYHQYLGYCVVQFVEKDASLTETVVKNLLRIWPQTNTRKEILFLMELEDILDVITYEEFAKVVTPVFKQLSKCMTSQQFQVAEKALCIRNNEYVFALMIENAQIVFPLLLPGLYSAKSHWNAPHVKAQAVAFLKDLKDVDPILYKRCKNEYKIKETESADSSNESSKSNETTPKKKVARMIPANVGILYEYSKTTEDRTMAH